MRHETRVYVHTCSRHEMSQLHTTQTDNRKEQSIQSREQSSASGITVGSGTKLMGIVNCHR